MTIRNFDKLMTPRSVVLIGASPEAGSIGRVLAHNLLAGGFEGPIWFVNPRRPEIDGHMCHGSIDELPGVPDFAVIATPPRTIPGIVADLGARGTRAAVIISAGLDTATKQATLDAARPHLLRIIGPNCLGMMLPVIGLNASFCHLMPAKGDLALVSQSGAIITATVDWAAGRGIGFSHVVSLGDMADADFGDLLDFLAGDTESRAILLYIEQVTAAAKFMSAARRAARAKPIITIKAGRHAEGQRAAASHTGALAGSDAAYEAAFRRSGVLRVTELGELFDAAEMLSRVDRLRGERLAILTNGGGVGVLAADRLADLGGRLATLADSDIAALDAVLPPTWSHANPVDIIGDADAGRYGRALEVLIETREADAIMVMNCPTALASSTEIAAGVVAVLGRSRRNGRLPKPVIANWLGDAAATQGRQLLAAAGVPIFETPAAAVGGFMQLVRYNRAQDELMRAPSAEPVDTPCDTGRAREVLAAAARRGTRMLSETDAKALLAAYSIDVVPTVIAATPAEVQARASEILAQHPACVVKVLSERISHKSDVGGVRLGIETAAAARVAAEEILARVARVQPDVKGVAFTVQPMIRRPGAHELIVGVSVDPTFGPLVMFGAGGTAVEVLRDTAHALPPIDAGLAMDLVRQTRIERLLRGYRDRPPADIGAIADTLVKVSAMVIAHPEIMELDINPLLADQNGVVALDARVRIARPGEAPRTGLSIRPYPAGWSRPVELAKYGPVTIRPIRPDDERLYQDFFAHVSPSDLRMRFFTARPDLSHKLVARLTQIDYAREMAFVAIDAASGDLLGVSRLAADPEYERAEYAVLVRSELKGKGLGWALMNHLIDYARAEGLREIHGDVLTENTTMLAMCRALGFAVTVDFEDPSLSRVALALR